ncbi:probable 28S ribosomal protein S26, mitochondrial [Leptidea sinapis]|uniref:probable 28S ribosomal protein S26, mitochondrial n=1 Tax=Leptidea sinapis TaxID=189913 RepID=UPI0021C3FC61|nr:probable 28S ribosomal protein S26, mitochondrial [Leptidea sinapis]
MISHKFVLNRACPILIQCAQAHRKPRWFPVAKSKIYRIPKRPQLSEEERLEILRITNNYKTQMRAVRKFYTDDMVKEKSTLESATSEMSQRLEAEEWQRCEELNEKWNKQIATEREERRKKELSEMEDFALARMEAIDREKRERVEKASEQIKREKELSETFISREKLEEAIDYALANPVDYNYAIDLKGNMHTGRDTPIQYENKERVQVSSK